MTGLAGFNSEGVKMLANGQLAAYVLKSSCISDGLIQCWKNQNKAKKVSNTQSDQALKTSSIGLGGQAKSNLHGTLKSISIGEGYWLYHWLFLLKR